VNIDEIVTRLVGPVSPVGDSGIDEKRIKSLMSLTALVDCLLLDIRNASSYASRPEASMNKIGLYARNYLAEVHYQTGFAAARKKDETPKEPVMVECPACEGTGGCAVHGAEGPCSHCNGTGRIAKDH
jgi:hypothetical protein